MAEEMTHMDQVRRILIINLGGIGDFLLSTPALRLLKAHFPGARLVFLGVSRVRACVDDSCIFDEVVTLDSGKALDVMRGLRAQHFDLAINMRTIVSWAGAAKIFFLFLWIGAKCWIGRDTDGKGFFFHIKIPETLKGGRYEMFYDLDAVSALGADVSRASLSLQVDPDALRQVAEGLEQDGVGPGEALVGIHPGGAYSHRWPLASYASLIGMLQKKIACRVVVTGGPGEEALCEALRKAAGAQVIDRVGKLNFKESVALISKCRLFISNDTGPMHIAAILGVSLVAIFGGGYLTRFDPRKISSRAVVLRYPVSCAPCDRPVCASLKCLRDILPDDVAKAAFKLLEPGT
jgi:heptosyltransferase-2